MNNSSLIYLFIAVPGILSCSNKADKVKEKVPVMVDVIIAEKVDFPGTIEVNGTSLSEEMIELYPETAGRLTYLNIPDGASVAQGTILAKINDAELQSQLLQQKVRLELAVKTEQRLLKLLEVGGVNQSEYDAALNEVNTLNANISVLNAQIDKTIVRAAFSGHLGLRMVSPGAFVTTQTLLGTLQQTDKVKIDFAVPETYSDLVKAGNTVSIITNESDQAQNAIISAVEPQIDLNTRNIKARARLENGNIAPGSFVKVSLTKNIQGIVVPTNAIIPDASSNQVVLIKNKKAKFVNVETGIRSADVVELVTGVNPGDTIVISGILFVRPNAVLKIRNIKTQGSTSFQDSKPAEK
jgi:membrane fusion protein (multidrug efflux system)